MRNDLPNLQRHNPPKRIFEYIQIVITNIRIQFSVLKNSWGRMTHDRHRVMLKANLEHFVLRWAKKGHQRNNSVKSFQNLTRSFRGEEFWSISASPYSAKSLSTSFKKGHPKNNTHPPPQAMFFDVSEFCQQLLKRVTQGTILYCYFKIWLAVSEVKIFKEFLKQEDHGGPISLTWVQGSTG